MRSLEVGLYPFWFWNGVQEELEIDRQLRLMKEAGCKGFALHSRTGNKIPYMSDRWMELFRHCCGRAMELGLRIWLYDEDGFPSGNAGGQVQKSRPDLIQKHLSFEYSGVDPANPAFIAFDASTYQPIDETSMIEDVPVLRFHLRSGHHVDTMSREAADLFIKLTHERYYEALKDYFGNPIEAVYTDDVSVITCDKAGLPWSSVLESAYKERYGVELKSILPLLVEDLPGHQEARLRYRGLVQELFLGNFIAPQKEWSERHGLVYLGHLCADEGPLAFCVNSFSSHMPYMALEHIPSIDDFLCDMTDHGYLRRAFNFDGVRFIPNGPLQKPSLLLYKHASSIAHQFKRGLVSCELLTFVKWECPSDFLDTQMLFEIGMGVNLMTPHAFYYTIGDGTKNDCPPSYFFQQPYFAVMGDLIRKWTRSAELLRRGKQHADVLMIFPTSLWSAQDGVATLAQFGPNTRFGAKVPKQGQTVAEAERQIGEASLELARRHVGFDFGDETLMAKEAIVEDGKIRIGAMSYGSVSLPTELPPLPSTVALLDRFKALGGKIIKTSEPASDIEIVGNGSEEILVAARDNDGFREFFLVNLSGRELRPCFTLGVPFKLYDPQIDKVFFEGERLPDDFVMRQGAACHVLPTSFECGSIPFGESVFISTKKSDSLVLKSVRPLSGNIMAYKKARSLEIDLPPKAKIKSVYAERLHEATPRINGSLVALKAIPSHPCDPCFQGIDADGLFKAGKNSLSFSQELETLYLAGEFGVNMRKDDLHSFLDGGRPGLGDLARQGYPFYWGAVDYEFEFEGGHRIVAFELDGMAEIFVNGKTCGKILGHPKAVSIASTCSVGTNIMLIRLWNNAQNFICADNPSPFGIKRAMLLD